MRINYFFLVFLLIPFFSFSQNGSFKVTILSEQSKEPIAGATVSLLLPNSNAYYRGGQSNSTGQVILTNITKGTFSLRISSIGMEDFEKKNVLIEHNATSDIGVVYLKAGANVIDEVLVKGKTPEMQLGIDKKVFDVSQSMVSVGGSAQDLLRNVPTLQVDMDGSVSLRGSNAVRILIDGKESAMAGSDVSKLLQSLPADAVSKVEIITNPSAKYDAEGQSGIINIVLKKNLRTGLNGTVNLSGGNYDNYNAGVSLNYRDNKFNYFGSYNFRYGNNVGESRVRSVELINGAETSASAVTETEGESFRKGLNNSFRLGADYYANEKTTFSLGANMSVRDNKRGEDILYRYYNMPDFGNTSPRTSRQKEKDLGYDITFDFRKELKRAGEELTTNVTFGDDTEDGTNDYVQRFDTNRLQKERKNSTAEQGQNWNFQLDYILPLGENHKFEAGYRTILRSSNENQYSDTLVNGMFLPDYEVSNDFEMKSGVHAFYVNYQRMLSSRIGAQLGLRAEDAFLNTTLTGKDPQNIVVEQGKQDYFRIYPSAFLTYDVNGEGDKVQLSYSRRVQRPRGWQVNPFVNLSDETNYRQGNPNLMPEDIHAVELSFAKFYSKWNFIVTSYYRYVNDMAQPFQLDDTDAIAAKYLLANKNATFSRWENVGSRNNAGLELISKVNISAWWDFMANANVFYMKVNPNPSFNIQSKDGYSWDMNLTSNVKFTPTTSLQVKGDYRAPMNTLQGQMKAMQGLDLALREDVLKGKGSIVFNVRDLFDSRKFGGESFLPTRYIDQTMRWSRRTFNLGFSYRFGIQDMSKNKKGKTEMSGDDGGMDF